MVVLESMKEYRFVKVKIVQRTKKGVIHVQSLKQHFTDELHILAFLPLAQLKSEKSHQVLDLLQFCLFFCVGFLFVCWFRFFLCWL